MRRVRSREAGAQASWLNVYRPLRHHVLNRLQVAYGWAQLGEGEEARAALEDYLQEEQRLSALLSSLGRRDQRALLTLLARCEREGRPWRLSGPALSLPKAAAAAAVAALRREMERGPGPIEIALAEDGVRIVPSEGGHPRVR